MPPMKGLVSALAFSDQLTCKDKLETTTSQLGVTIGTLSRTKSPAGESRTKPATLGIPSTNSSSEHCETTALSYLSFDIKHQFLNELGFITEMVFNLEAS